MSWNTSQQNVLKKVLINYFIINQLTCIDVLTSPCVGSLGGRLKIESAQRMD